MNKKRPVIPRPVVLIILDGWGIAPASEGNALSKANLPNFNKYWTVYPHTQLLAHGDSVGLPGGTPGNSEVGHLNIGAGRVVYQELPRISMSIADGTFIRNTAFLSAADHARQNNSSLHLVGLVGPGKVHSSIEHLLGLLWFCKEQALKKVYLHLFTDGRDAPPFAALDSIAQVEQKLVDLNLGAIATIAGRYYGMDRDNRWDRIKLVYEAMVYGSGLKALSAKDAIEQAYKENRSDEFIIPNVIIQKDGNPIAQVSPHDSVIFFNYRPDRARQLTKAFVLPNFESAVSTQENYDPYMSKYKTPQTNDAVTTFKRGPQIPDLLFVTMTEYEKGLPALVAYPYEQIDQPIASIISEHGMKQLHIAETEKYAHVTYFFNGRREDSFPLEDRVVVASPKVATYDMKPEMSTLEITNVLLSRLRQGVYDFIVVNFASPDMVSHTGVLDAAVLACEVVDECLGVIVKNVNLLGGACVITADHGNVEEMINFSTGQVDTEHNSNPVPLIVIRPTDFSDTRRALPMGTLVDVAPTILDLMGISKPAEMTGRSLIT